MVGSAGPPRRARRADVQGVPARRGARDRSRRRRRSRRRVARAVGHGRPRASSSRPRTSRRRRPSGCGSAASPRRCRRGSTACSAPPERRAIGSKATRTPTSGAPHASSTWMPPRRGAGARAADRGPARGARQRARVGRRPSALRASAATSRLDRVARADRRLSTTLETVGLTGQVLSRPAGRSLIGAVQPSEFERRVRMVMDPDGRFRGDA